MNIGIYLQLIGFKMKRNISTWSAEATSKRNSRFTECFPSHWWWLHCCRAHTFFTDDLCRYSCSLYFTFHPSVPSRHCWTSPRNRHPGWGCACAGAPPPASASSVPASARCGGAAPCSGSTASPPPSRTGGLQWTIFNSVSPTQPELNSGSSLYIYVLRTTFLHQRSSYFLYLQKSWG